MRVSGNAKQDPNLYEGAIVELMRTYRECARNGDAEDLLTRIRAELMDQQREIAEALAEIQEERLDLEEARNRVSDPELLMKGEFGLKYLDSLIARLSFLLIAIKMTLEESI